MAVNRLLVANRGEIAVRIFRTCARLGIESVAVAAPDDRGAFHARAADRTIEIASYLEGAEHVRAALEVGADAVHPGYGFLAENAGFAEAVIAAGIAWVGPSPEALRLGGDKLAAKRIAREAGVPTLPQGSADEIGFPLVVKAAAGGGGRGMRIVRSAGELDEALAAAAREAEAAFGDDTVFCERYLERPRHVEAQILGHHGGVAVLGDRDCSVQRRHQKLVEESPALGLDPRAWPRIAAAARAFAEAIGYVSAGTAEFLVDGPEVFFLELNGRIQVEHPVTEAVTGLDIVELQLRVAAGEEVEIGRSPGGPRDRGAPLRRGPADVPAADRTDQPPRAPGRRPCRRRGRGRRRDRALLRPADREADRTRRRPWRGPGTARSGPRLDHDRGSDDEPAVPALARPSPGLP